MTFSQLLKDERKRLGLTQAQADEAVGLGKGQFKAWESERNNPHQWMKEGCLNALRAIKTPKKTKP